MLIAAATASCASPQPKTPFPERFIDQPPTLSEALLTWKPRFAHEWGGTDSESVALPLQWEQGLSDRTTLVWSPFPTGLRYRLSEYRLSEGDEQGERDWTWIELTWIGAAENRTRDFNWAPGGQLARALRFAPDWRAEAGVVFEPEIRRGARMFHLSAGGRAALDFQPEGGFFSPLWLGMEASLLREWGAPRARYLASLPLRDEQGSRWQVALAPRLGAQLSPRWLAQARFQSLWITDPAGFNTRRMTLWMTYFW